MIKTIKLISLVENYTGWTFLLTVYLFNFRCLIIYFGLTFGNSHGRNSTTPP